MSDGEEFTADGDYKPLYEALCTQFHSVPTYSELEIREGAHKLQRHGGKQLSIATGWSGTDIGVKALRCVMNLFKNE